jgi:hypothetical protein
VSYHIVLPGEAHRVAETQLKICAVEMAKYVLDEQSKKENCNRSVI